MCFALTIPELLENVFLHSEQGSLARSLLVCRHWYVVGRSVLWRHIEGHKHFKGLVSLLGRLTEYGEDDSDDEQETFAFALVRYPQAGNWARFVRHAKCVREMSLKSLQKYGDVFRIMAESKPSFALFPKLRSLKYAATYQDLQHCIHFMHPSVKRFTFSALGQNRSPRKQLYHDHLRFLVDSIPRMSMLQHLEFYMEPDSQYATVPPLVCVIRQITTLQTIILPRYALTASILDQLSSLPQLRVLQTHKTIGSPTSNDIASFEPGLLPDSFPALRKLTLSAKPGDVAQFLSSNAFVSNLHALALDLDDVEPDGLPILLNVVATSCSALREVSVVRRASDDFSLNWNSVDPELTLDSFAPILSCPNLVDIEIEHEGIFYFTTADLEDLASRIPHVERLVLHGSHIGVSSVIRLPHLLIFARRCPALITLGLDVDATEVNDLPIHDLPEFKSLRCLDLGESYIGRNIDPVAFFLAQICPPSCTLKVWEALSGWGRIADVLPLLVKMRVFKSREPTGSAREGVQTGSGSAVGI